jgi:hypothetical protein
MRPELLAAVSRAHDELEKQAFVVRLQMALKPRDNPPLRWTAAAERIL